jgi:sialate O-acetylesterase
MSKEALDANAEFSEIVKRGATYKKDPNQASNLYDGMIHPLVPYGIKGAIWYQGESNLGRASQYRTLLAAMIGDWRQRFGQGDFPFGIVQIAPYRYGGRQEMLGELWESQFEVARRVPNTGIAPTTDIGDIKDIHPKNKQEVGRRLALWAEATVYGMKDVAYQGPTFDSMTVEGKTARIKFKNAEGLTAKNGLELTFFEVGGDDGKFEAAQARIDGETVVVDLGDRPAPAHVRFAWNHIAEPNLFNKAGLPAYPFRTDKLKLLSADAK